MCITHDKFHAINQGTSNILYYRKESECWQTLLEECQITKRSEDLAVMFILPFRSWQVLLSLLLQSSNRPSRTSRQQRIKWSYCWAVISIQGVRADQLHWRELQYDKHLTDCKVGHYMSHITRWLETGENPDTNWIMQHMDLCYLC